MAASDIDGGHVRLHEYKAICVDGDRKRTITMGIHIYGYAPLSTGDRFRFMEEESKDSDAIARVITLSNGLKITKMLSE